ncbi:MAG: hypothetical protein ACLFR0_00825 [Alphaproteobacteria bacterium]
MLINAKELLRKNALASVILPDAAATEKLGQDFAPSLFMDWSDVSATQKRTRVALHATPGTGKTAFAKGLFSTLNAPITVECRQDFLRLSRFNGKTITQKWLRSTEMGHVCHVDTGFGQEFWRVLEPYREKLLEAQKLGGVDIVENAETDERYDQFDCAIWLERTFDDNNIRVRQAYIYATQDFAARPAFREFLNRQNLVNPIGDIQDELDALDGP